MLQLLIAFMLCCASAAHAADMFRFANQPGPYPVGLRVHQQYDQSRVFKTRTSLITGQPTSGERARPLQVLVWYPAEPGGKAVTFRDYLALGATEADFTRTPEEVRRVTDRLIAERTDGRADAAQITAQRMWAVRNAAQRRGKFPVVIYAPSFSASAAENPDLCEYLASQGYVVIASPSLGPHTRAMTVDMQGLETQASDIAYLLSYAATLAQADMDQIAVAGFSWGGLANVFAAARDDRIKALVSLDGSVRYFPELVDGGGSAARHVNPAQVPVPMLFVARRPPSIEELNRNGNSTAFSFLNKMTYADLVMVTMHPMRHADFSASGQRLAPDTDFDEFSRAEVAEAYSQMARYVHRFLDAYLKHDAGARAFLDKKPVANGVPPHMMSLETRRGSGVPPTREAFVGELAARGFDKAAAIYAEMRTQGASFTFEPSDINSWGYELLRSGMVGESIAIFTFGTTIFPQDANLFDSLGEAQSKGGLDAEAVRSYRRSLELNPRNRAAVERVKALDRRLNGPSGTGGASAR